MTPLILSVPFILILTVYRTNLRELFTNPKEKLKVEDSIQFLYKSDFFELFHIHAQPFIERFGFIAEFLMNKLPDLIDRSLPVNTKEDEASHSFKFDM